MLMTPVLLEVVAPMLSTNLTACRSCSLIFSESGFARAYNEECSGSDFPEHYTEATQRLSDCLGELARLYKHRIAIRLIDAMSPVGLWKQIRHGVFRTPAFIVDRKSTYSGLDTGTLEALIDERLRELTTSSAGG